MDLGRRLRRVGHRRVFCLRFPQKQHAELAFLMALLFGIAWGFYRQQKD